MDFASALTHRLNTLDDLPRHSGGARSRTDGARSRTDTILMRQDSTSSVESEWGSEAAVPTPKPRRGVHMAAVSDTDFWRRRSSLPSRGARQLGQQSAKTSGPRSQDMTGRPSAASSSRRPALVHAREEAVEGRQVSYDDAMEGGRSVGRPSRNSMLQGPGFAEAVVERLAGMPWAPSLSPAHERLEALRDRLSDLAAEAVVREPETIAQALQRQLMPVQRPGSARPKSRGGPGVRPQTARGFARASIVSAPDAGAELLRLCPGGGGTLEKKEKQEKHGICKAVAPATFDVLPDPSLRRPSTTPRASSKPQPIRAKSRTHATLN